MAGEEESDVRKKEIDIRRDLELLEKIQDKEERLRVLLSPAESHIIWFQKVLVWEHPYLSVALFLTVNIFFWLATTWRIYCLIGITGMIAVALEMWLSLIWAESIGGDGTDGNDSQSWTEVCPRLLSVPEISYYLARWWVYGLQQLDLAISFRTENKPKFFVYSIFFLTLFAVVGIYIPGIYITYFTVMGLLLWPSIAYHSVIDRIKVHVNPVIEGIERKLNIKRRRHKKSGRRRRKGRRNLDATEDDSDSDRDIDEFIPPTDALMMTTLKKATVEPSPADDDDDSAGYTPSEFTPRMPSQAESHEHTDDEFLSEDLSILAHDLKEMPSIDDLDLTHAEAELLLPQPSDSAGDANADRLLSISDNEEDDDNEHQFIDPEMPQTLEEADKMTFVQSHFKESSDEDDEEKLARGLSFTDLPDESSEVADAKPEGESRVLGVIGGLISQSHSSLVAAFKSPVLSQTVSSVMTTTLSGLGALRASVTGDRRDENSEVGEVPSTQPAAATGGSKEPADGQSSEMQVLESEFEFLEQEELDLMSLPSNK